MEQGIIAVLPTSLESVRSQFETWRETKTNPRERIPEDLWAEAVKLGDQYPINQISRSLRLNYTELKNRIFGACRQPSDQSAPAAFVELDCLEPYNSSECIVEMADAGGSRMKMTFKGQAGLDLLELGKAFWSKDK
jgi:hypothetical protein